MRRLTAVAKSLAPALTAGLFLAAQSAASAAPGDTLYTHPGQLVSANGARLNLYCMGSGSPAVVFDSGWEDWAPSWALVQPRVAKWTRACTYDRAGAGFSEPGPMPRTSMRIADELHTALRNAGVAGPYILVGHAFGGDNVRVFADRYLREVAGLVLVEADASDLEPKAMQEADHRGELTGIAQLRACRDAIMHHESLPMLSQRPGQPPQNCSQQFFRRLPEKVWSQQLNEKLLQLARTKIALYDAYISEMEEMPADETYLRDHRRSLGSRPVRILTTGNHGVHALDPKRKVTAEHLKYEQEIAQAQAQWLTLSTNAKQVFAYRSSEYIPYDEPDVVVDTIREVYDQSRQ